jgi:hypothetical protein
VNDVAGGEIVSARNSSLAGRAAPDRAALGEQARACCAVDRAVNTASAEQRGIRRVDDRIDALPRYVALDDFDSA